LFLDASLVEADLSKASFVRSDFRGADLRRAIFDGARLDNTVLTGAKVHGATLGQVVATTLIADWVDASRNADGSERLTHAQLLALIAGVAQEVDARTRYIGAGDMLRNAELSFGDAAEVRVDGHLDGCSIELAINAHLVIGDGGLLERCQIRGGNVEIHGCFLERDRPGFIEPSSLIVSASGSVAATIHQPADKTRFAFARGCRLRLNIKQGT
jgi:hypothetical protein